MKKNFLIFSFCILLSTGYSQKHSFISGLYLNANGTHFEGQSQAFWDGQVGKIWGHGGWSAGINIKRYLNTTLYVNFEFRYIRKGSVYEYLNVYAMQALETVKLHYIEAPISIGYSLKFNKKHIHFETGVGYAKLLSSSISLNPLSNRTQNPDLNDFKSSDLSSITSIKFPLNKRENFLLGFRFSYSLRSIHEYYKLYNMVYGIQLECLLNK